jgi:hypothetical protein
MYISGHSEIFTESVKGTSIIKDLEKLKYMYVSEQLLWKGMKYPDFPCGEYKFENGKFKVTKNLCNIFRFADDIVFAPELYSLAYSSHYGLFSIWHSMTFDPTKTVLQVRNKIVNHLITLCKLSLKDTTTKTSQPNIFWLGMVLHTIMDSYSPAHLLRSNTIKNIDYNHLINVYLPRNKLVIDKSMKTYLKILKDLKQRVSTISIVMEEKDEQELEEVVQELAKKYDIKRTKSIRHLAQLTKFFYFHINRQQSFKKYKGHLKSYVPKTMYSTNHSIINFYYYPAQKGFFHKKFDLLMYCKQMGLFNDSVEDVKYVLTKYIETIKELKTTTQRDMVINTFLNKIYAYLVNRTFHIEKDCEELSSGFNITEYLKTHRKRTKSINKSVPDFTDVLKDIDINKK